METRRSALIQSSAARTFDLIEAAEDYPEFLPWCANAVIITRDENVVVAKLTVDYHGLRFDLTTRNPKKRNTGWRFIWIAGPSGASRANGA